MAFLAMLASCGGGSDNFVIDSTPTTRTAIRQIWSYQITAHGGTAPVDYTIFSAPVGTQITPTGLVAWTPEYADLGDHVIAVRATASNGVTQQNFTLTVHQGIDMGVALSPRGHTQSSTTQDYVDHLDPASPHGRLRAFHGSWRDSVAEAGQIPTLLQTGMSFTTTYGITPAYVIGWADGTGTPDLTSTSEPANNTWSNSETRSEFLAMVTAFAQAAQPPYLMLGNEVNFFLTTHSGTEWDDWVSEYQDCYTAIQTVSPGTIVGMVFQLELLKGLGANAGWSQAAQWTEFDALVGGGHLDAVAFTSYPYLEYATPSLLPTGYYDEIAAHWSGDVIFTEIAWPAVAHAPYPGSESDQAAFVDAFFAGTADLDMRYVAWLFLHDYHDQASTPAFQDIGLRDNTGSQIRAADALWQAAVALRQQPAQ
ncbi:MAG: hypothetical protein U1E73_00260 [Planctomycetota bacterium]